MNLKPGTRSHKAYHQGVEAFNRGLGEGCCPYITGRVQMLKSWWMVGYYELDNAKLHNAKKNNQNVMQG
jgi:hypothetical protein